MTSLKDYDLLLSEEINNNSDTPPPSPDKTRYPTPINEEMIHLHSKEEKISQIAFHFEKIMEILGLDISDPSLEKTPERVAKAYVNDLFSGLNQENFPKITFVHEDYGKNNNLNVIKISSSFTSMCEHHFLPMHGTCWISYIPQKKMIGLSKIPRLVRYFARRPQIQERLTAQIADSLATLLETDHIHVKTSAKHFCVCARGIEDGESETICEVGRGKLS